MLRKLMTILLISFLAFSKVLAVKIPDELNSKNVKFYVQIGISSIPIDRGEYAKIIGYPTKSVSVFKHDGFYRYVIGESDYLDEAIEICDRLITKKGMKDLLIVGSIDDSYVELIDLLPRCIEENSYRLNNLPLEEGEKQLNVPSHDDVIYHIQVLALRNKQFNSSKLSFTFVLEEKILVDDYDGIKHFMIGSEKDEKKAREMLRKLKNKGISDAFLVAYQNGKRIALNQYSN